MPTVREIQQRLLDQGFDPKGVDGDLGRNTIAAIAAFQKARKLDIKFPGTIGPKTLTALGFGADPIAPAWVIEARKLLGLHEVANASTLDKLLRLDASEIPWCGALQQAVIAKVLPKEPLPSNPLWARSWAKFGTACDIVEGAIATFERGTGGHVGQVVGHDKTALHILGGNQSNKVSIARVAKNRLLALRFPVTGGSPGPKLAESTIGGTLSQNEA